MALTGTKRQLDLERLLNKLGFEVILEHAAGPYFLDLYLPEMNIGVEYDGPIHGLTKKRDAKRDAELVGLFGIKRVIRITEKDFANTKGLTEKILGEIDAGSE